VKQHALIPGAQGEQVADLIRVTTHDVTQHDHDTLSLGERVERLRQPPSQLARKQTLLRDI
jgi:hypothetical protein